MDPINPVAARSAALAGAYAAAVMRMSGVSLGAASERAARTADLLARGQGPAAIIELTLSPGAGTVRPGSAG